MGKRFKNANWDIPTTASGQVQTDEGALLAVLMDVRDELQTLNRIIGCPNFIDIPNRLSVIVRNTAPKPRRRKKKG